MAASAADLLIYKAHGEGSQTNYQLNQSTKDLIASLTLEQVGRFTILAEEVTDEELAKFKIALDRVGGEITSLTRASLRSIQLDAGWSSQSADQEQEQPHGHTTQNIVVEDDDQRKQELERQANRQNASQQQARQHQADQQQVGQQQAGQLQASQMQARQQQADQQQMGQQHTGQ